MTGFDREKIMFIKALDALVDYHNLMRGNMTTATVTKKPNRFVSFLEALGHDFKTGFTKAMPIIETAGETAVSIFAPGASALFNQTVAAAITAEQSAAAVGQQGNDVQKLSAVASLMGPLIKQALADVGKTADDAAVEKYISAVVTILGAIPVPAPAEAPAPTAIPLPPIPAPAVTGTAAPAPVVSTGTSAADEIFG
jgi:hypothetical protein